jgi:hypothetical protein
VKSKSLSSGQGVNGLTIRVLVVGKNFIIPVQHPAENIAKPFSSVFE